MSGRVDKVIRIVAASSQSWEAAAQNAVSEAAKSIRDLTTARVVQQDLIIVDDKPVYRIRLQVCLQVDRSRSDATGATVVVRRYLIVANDSLSNPGLVDFIRERESAGAEFHVVAPQVAPSVLHADPATGLIGPAAHTMVAEARDASRAEAERRLAGFRRSLGGLDSLVTSEVVLSDPITAIRMVMARSSFDEIVISAMAPGLSRWLRLDLPSRVERAFKLPVTIIQQAP